MHVSLRACSTVWIALAASLAIASAAQAANHKDLLSAGQSSFDLAEAHADRAEALRKTSDVKQAETQEAQAQAEYEGSLRLWRQALAIKPNSIETRVRIATALTALRRYDEAEEELNSALNVKPGAPMVLFHMAALRMKQENWPSARQLLRATLASAPWYPEANYLLGYILEREGDYAGAARAYVAERKVNPASANAVYHLQRLQKEGKFGRNWDRPVQWTWGKIVSIALVLIAGAALLAIAAIRAWRRNRQSPDIDFFDQEVSLSK